MQIFQKILCPIDFSEPSIRALQWAEYLARKHNSELTVLHVMEPFSSTVDLGIDYQDYHDRVVRNMKELLSALTIPFHPMLSSGNASVKIPSLAETLGCSLIAMSTRGLSGMAHRLIGSTAENVIRHSTMPVMTFSPSCALPNTPHVEHALVPVLELKWPVKGYVRLRKVIRDLGASISVMNVIDSKDPMFDSSFHANPYLVTNCQISEKTAALQTIGLQLDRDAASVGTIVQFGDASKEILAEAEKGYGWIVMNSKRQKLLSRFFGSTTYDVISRANIPVITIGVQ